MKNISDIIKNIKNLLPYLLLIAIYLFFVNLEAGKDKETIRINEIKDMVNDYETMEINKQQRIRIPVIPYE